MTGYRRCVTEESAQRQRQFENALLELMLQMPLNQISIQEICTKVGVSRKSFYRYFSSREDCLCALIDQAIEEQTDWPLDLNHVQETLRRYFLYWKGHQLLLEALIRNELGNLLFERGMACAAREFGIHSHGGMQDGSYSQTIFIVSGLTGVLLNWHQEGYLKPPEELAATLSKLLPSPLQSVF